MTCCIEMESPQSVLTEKEIDVFEQIIPNTDYQYAKKRSALWSYYRYRGIPTCNLDYWIQCMTDRYAVIKESMDIKIKAWEKFLTDTSTGIDLSDGTNDYTLTTEYEDTPDTNATGDKYLSSKTTQTYNGATKSDLESETIRDYIKAVPDPWEMFAKEFDRYFWIGV